MPDKPAPFAKKSFGQNFLVDRNYSARIVESLKLNSEDVVVEIGPGRGALTEELIRRAGKVIVIELDRDMIAVQREKFGSFPNFGLVESDALLIDFSKLTGPSSNRKIKLIANLPYYISTAILQKLIEQRAAFSELVLMFQREVVDRITAAPGSSERGYLTVLVEASMHVEKLFDVPPSAFRPAPKIWSSVVRLKPKPTLSVNEAVFRQIVSTAFVQKRKTILNNLKQTYPNALRSLQAAAIDTVRRAETLTLPEWNSLAESLASVGPQSGSP